MVSSDVGEGDRIGRSIVVAIKSRFPSGLRCISAMISIIGNVQQLTATSSTTQLNRVIPAIVCADSRKNGMKRWARRERRMNLAPTIKRLVGAIISWECLAVADSTSFIFLSSRTFTVSQSTEAENRRMYLLHVVKILSILRFSAHRKSLIYKTIVLRDIPIKCYCYRFEHERCEH